MATFKPVGGTRHPAPTNVRLSPDIGAVVRKHADRLDTSNQDFVEQCVRFAVEHMETAKRK